MNNLNPKQLEALLAMASKKLGTTPQELQKQMESGSFDKAFASLSPQQGAMLKQALSDPKTAEKMLSTPQAQALYKKLTQ